MISVSPVSDVAVLLLSGVCWDDDAGVLGWVLRKST
jgi:hypothetical protein